MNLIKKICAAVLLTALAVSSAMAEALDLYCVTQKADEGQTPVIIYLEGSAWRAEQTIMGNELFRDMNIMCVCSQNKEYNFSAIWREKDMLGLGENIVYRVWQEFPEAAEVVIIGFSNGGYGMEGTYRKCKEYGITVLAGVCMDAWPKRFAPEDMAEEVPVMYMISGTTIRDHVTERTKQRVKNLAGGGGGTDVQGPGPRPDGEGQGSAGRDTAVYQGERQMKLLVC